jgi:hypothetical protein
MLAHRMLRRVRVTQVGSGSNPNFLLVGRTSASAECRHWSARAVRWASCAILLRPGPAAGEAGRPPGFGGIVGIGHRRFEHSVVGQRRENTLH